MPQCPLVLPPWADRPVNQIFAEHRDPLERFKWRSPARLDEAGRLGFLRQNKSCNPPDRFLLSRRWKKPRRSAAPPGVRSALARTIAQAPSQSRGHALGRSIRSAALPGIAADGLHDADRQGVCRIRPSILPAAASQLEERHLDAQARVVRAIRHSSATESSTEGDPRVTPFDRDECLNAIRDPLEHRSTRPPRSARALSSDAPYCVSHRGGARPRYRAHTTHRRSSNDDSATTPPPRT
jgi:hypothetical protein